MIEVTIDSVRVSLMSQHRVVVLKEVDGERYLPIWIGPFEADAITIQLQGIEVARPMTHDLLMRIITTLEAQVLRVLINELHSETFFATIVVDAARRDRRDRCPPQRRDCPGSTRPCAHLHRRGGDGPCGHFA
ncbi:bifunctional nuclease family protein [Candidatus Amarobacter glycogenicus]|uniref:bifunctional nuclease family protein n=1 Tax=Candidatus Amarobacter glycogenicus TaxID=3140699 RepID=UPI0031CCCB1D